MKTFGFYNASIRVAKSTNILFFQAWARFFFTDPEGKKTSGLSIVFFCLLLTACKNEDPKNAELIKPVDSLGYLNHADSASYVGMNTCKLCHQDIYNTFIKTGMGKSFGIATKQKSAADFQSASIYDKIADLHYKAYWQRDSLYIKEFRLTKKDTMHLRVEQVNYIIGSGQHTNSHLQSNGGYINQMPMTFYTQKKHWDLPPGFENGVNTRFSRKIGLECMSCHNGYPDFVLGSENKFKSVPGGIDCERCHGPGSIHLAQRQSGTKVDTARYIDYSIVNPSKLSIDAQFDLCQRCHLQGNAILKEGKSFYDFKPGQKLSDFISVFLPKYKNADEEFIMASHADRLKQSACFIKSIQKVQNKTSLKPYKEAMTCITCHNPHISVRETNSNVFNDACKKCHQLDLKASSEHAAIGGPISETCFKKSKTPDCVSCHMPLSGSIDIPHVTVHDHYIRKPISQKEKDKIKTFVVLFSINEKNPDYLTRAKAYINQYDKFDANASYLDSASIILAVHQDTYKNRYALIQLYFIKQDFKKIISVLNELGEQACYDQYFVAQSYENLDAWAAYRIAEAFHYTGNAQKSLKWFKRAVSLAPSNLDFKNKLGTALAGSNAIAEAMQQFEAIIKENPRYVSAYANLGYLKLVQGVSAEALRLYKIGINLDPDNETLLLNLAAYYLFVKDKKAAKEQIEKILKKDPTNTKAKQALHQLNA